MNQFIYKALNDSGLTDGEFRLYMLVKELGNNNAGYCYAKNSYFAKVLGKHEKSVSRLVSSLIEKGYLYMISLTKGTITEERRLYVEESYKTYLEDLQGKEEKTLIKTVSIKEKAEDGDETTLIVNERNYKEYTGNKNTTGNKNVTGTSNNIVDGTSNNIVTQNIYNKNNNNKNKKILSKDNIEKVQKEWNTLASELNLPKIDKIDGKRLSNLNARIKKYNLEKFLEVMQTIRKSRFLKGEVNEFRATFDFLVTASSFEKIKDGNYIDNKNTKKSNTDSMRRLAEL
jgi:hypothetical protein